MLIAVDRNPYAERAVLLGSNGRPVSHFIGSGTKNCEAWLRQSRTAYPGTPIVASPLDKWPEVDQRDPDIRWLHPGLVKRLYSVCQPWNLRRKLHRANLFAYLYEIRASASELEETVRDFELKSAYQLIDELA